MKTLFDADRKIVFEFITNVIPLKNKITDATENRETLISIIGLALGCHKIKLSILTSVKEKNTYAANILLRSLIEHYTKFTYVMYRFSKENNNNVGRDNLVFQKAAEIKSYGNALDFYNTLSSQQYDKVNKKLAIAKISPDAEGKSLSDLDKIDKQFKYRSIIKYFNETEPDFFNSQFEVFAPMVVQYSELSSFTHGGAWANESFDEEEKEYLGYLRKNVIMIAAAVYSMSCLALSRLDPNLRAASERINLEVNRIKSN